MVLFWFAECPNDFIYQKRCSVILELACQLPPPYSHSTLVLLLTFRRTAYSFFQANRTATIRLVVASSICATKTLKRCHPAQSIHNKSGRPTFFQQRLGQLIRTGVSARDDDELLIVSEMDFRHCRRHRHTRPLNVEATANLTFNGLHLNPNEQVKWNYYHG